MLIGIDWGGTMIGGITMTRAVHCDSGGVRGAPPLWA
jgi:hypothetical protein